jgi:hypothetical protein
VYGVNIDMAIFPVFCTGTTSIDKIQNLEISIFPNPAGSELFVVLPNLDGEKVDVSIMDVYGKLCKSVILNGGMDGSSRIDLNGLSNGIYILQGESSKGIFTEKFSIIK